MTTDLKTDMKKDAWKRWPCAHCSYQGKRFAIICPECEAPPWTEERNGSELARHLLPSGAEMETKNEGLFRMRHRLSTPAGFLGILSRRLGGQGDWLGVDGREWRIARAAPFGRAFVLRDGDQAIAAAEGSGWRGTYRLRQGKAGYTLRRTGVARHNFLLTAEEDQEVLRIQGGLIDPIRRVRIEEDVPLATTVLSVYLACGMRQSDSVD